MESQQFPAIEFVRFNNRRHIRGAAAAEFKVIEEADGDYFLLWMSKKDIQINIKNLPHAAAELQKGLAHY